MGKSLFQAGFLASLCVLMFRLAAANTGPRCKKSCRGLPDGDYQSCTSCNHYISCSGGYIIPWRPCPWSWQGTYLVWDDILKRCDYTSTTCSLAVGPVGQWSRWEPWTDCSKTCGGGITTRSRACTDPAPVKGGRPCLGRSIQTSKCAVRECTRPPYQCSTEKKPKKGTGLCKCPEVNQMINVLTPGIVSNTRQDFPLAHAKIYAVGARSLPRRSQSSNSTRTRLIYLGETDAAGDFLVSGVCEGTILVIVKSGYPTQEVNLTLLQCSKNNNTRFTQRKRRGANDDCVFQAYAGSLVVNIHVHPFDHHLLAGSGMTADLICGASCDPICVFDWLFRELGDLTGSDTDCSTGNVGTDPGWQAAETGMYHCRVETCNTCDSDSTEVECRTRLSHLAEVRFYDNVLLVKTSPIKIKRKTACGTSVTVRLCREWPCAGQGTCWQPEAIEHIPTGCGDDNYIPSVPAGWQCQCEQVICPDPSFVIKLRFRIFVDGVYDANKTRDAIANLHITYAGVTRRVKTTRGLRKRFTIVPTGHTVIAVNILPNSPINPPFQSKLSVIHLPEINALDRYLYRGVLVSSSCGKRRRRSMDTINQCVLAKEEFISVSLDPSQVFNVNPDDSPLADYNVVSLAPRRIEEVDKMPGDYIYLRDSGEPLPMLIYAVVGIDNQDVYVSGKVDLTVEMEELLGSYEQREEVKIYKLIEQDGEWHEIKNLDIPDEPRPTVEVEFAVGTPQFLAVGRLLDRVDICITTVVVTPVIGTSHRVRITSFDPDTEFFVGHNVGYTDGFGYANLTHACGYQHRVWVEFENKSLETGDHVLPVDFDFLDENNFVVFNSSNAIVSPEGPYFRLIYRMESTRQYYFNFTIPEEDFPVENWLVRFGYSSNVIPPWYPIIQGNETCACFVRFNVTMVTTSGSEAVGFIAHSLLGDEDLGYFMMTLTEDAFVCIQFRCPLEDDIIVNVTAVNNAVTMGSTTYAGIVSRSDGFVVPVQTTSGNECGLVNQAGFYSKSANFSGTVASFDALEECENELQGIVGHLTV